MRFFSRNRWILVTAGHYITLFVLEQINYYLSPLGLYLLLTGMLLAFSSLVLSPSQGALSLVPIGLYLDSKSPLPFGSSLLMLIGLHFLAVVIRYQFRRESEGISLVFALVANLGLHALYSVFATLYLGSESLNPLQIGLNLLASGMVIALVNGFYFSAMIEYLSYFGVNIAQEQRQSR